ncbi:MAG: hypothetical protein II517_00125, partial [Ruminococcus sp.]|nr:hypothetical protein [Ruminococcus sp.]
IFNHIFYYPIHRQTGSLTIHAALEKDQTPVADSFSNAGIHFSNKQNAAGAKRPPRQRSRNAHRGSGRGMPTAAAVGRKPFREGRAFCQRKEIYAMSLVVDRLLFRKQNLRLFFSAEQIID